MRRERSALLSGKTVSFNWAWLGTGLFVTIAMVAVTVWHTWPQPGRATETPPLLEGYLDLVPPNTLSGPGTINTVELLGHGRVQLYPTCDARPDLLVDKIQKSRTVSYDMKRAIEKTLNTSAEFQEKLKAGVGLNEVSSIHVTLEKANILTISDESMLLARKALLKDTCEVVVTQNIANGGIVCQTRSVLEADVVYDIIYNDKVSVEERAKLTPAVAAKLDMNASQEASNQISGVQLFFSVNLAPNPIIAGASPSAIDCTVVKKM